MSLHGSMVPVTARWPLGVTSKNSFLDCPAPWTDNVTVGERPKSDPTSDRPSFSASDRSHSGDVHCPSGEGRRATEEGAGQQSDKDGDGSSPRSGAGISGNHQVISRSQRRRMQRIAKNNYFETVSSASTPIAHSSGSGVSREHVATDSSNAIQIGTKISL
ncbi:unnamed protein product [Prorocentrum cordatum]|uniref:Uncharacterized protein n=1 Tax=Prorocentrum cordatum TaxID=2364126 RepID=A0ABN9QEE6_9DINO|nr:unnamed protein product [Polarella glacialis]